MSDTHLANAPEARTTSGEIKDATTGKAPTETTTTVATETKPTETTTTTETAKAPEKKDGEKSLLNQDGEKPKEGEAATGAPEKYEAFRAPEGFQFAEAAMTEFTGVAKELGLSQDAAQKIVDVYAKHTAEQLAAPAKAWNDTVSAWTKETTDHPDLKGRLSEVKINVGRALDSLGDPQLADNFRAAMDVTGVGNHPAFVRVFDKISQLLNEGKPATGGGPTKAGQTKPGTGEKPSPAKAMFPGLPSATG